MKEINSPDEVPEFSSDEEAAEFWETHSLGPEFLKQMKPPPEGLLPEPRPRKQT